MRQEFQRGQVWFYEPSNEVKSDSHVQQGPRPVIIVSNSAANRFSGALLAVPCTSKPKKNLPTHVLFVMDGKFNVALTEQAGPVDINNLVNLKYTVEPYLMEQIDEALKIAFGLKTIPFEERTVNDVHITSTLTDDIILGGMSDTIKKKWGNPEKLQYLWDYSNNGSEFCVKKYRIKNSSASVYYSNFKKDIDLLRKEHVNE